MEGREITMRLKRLILVAVYVFVIGIVFCAGYITGGNRTVKRELNVSIPVHVQVYRTIKKGDPDRAATLISMVLMGKVGRYDSLKDDWLFHVAGGSGLSDSTQLQESVAEARKIAAEEKTNLVTIMPEQRK
jgi:hypothetical protein